MIIGIHLQGGLGNMLFQIIAGECLAKKYGIEVCYPNIRQHFDFLRSFGRWVSHCDEYLTAFKNIDWFKNEDRWHKIKAFKLIPFTYTEIMPENGMAYKGYFQSEKNFFGYSDFVRELLELSWFPDVTEYMPERSCSIHVRRGNYLLNQNYHVVQDMGYYEAAMYMIDADRYYIFSDDIAWCKENFKGDKFSFVQMTDYIEMHFMSKCKHHIIGNSSFGWLGAYLDPHPHKLVIAPERWFPSTPDSRDIIPDNWIKV